jgi:hypothetical protein
MYSTFSQYEKHSPNSDSFKKMCSSIDESIKKSQYQIFSSQGGSYRKKEGMLNSKVYYLNCSRSKFICVGMSLDDFSPLIQIGGQNGYRIYLNEEEWKCFLQSKAYINDFLYSNYKDDDSHNPVKCGDVTIYFEKYNENSLIKIKHINEYYVTLNFDSTQKLWELADLVNYRLKIIKNQGFNEYFSVLSENLEKWSEDLIQSVYKLLDLKQNVTSENVSTVLEFALMYPAELLNKIQTITKRRKYYAQEGNF